MKTRWIVFIALITVFVLSACTSSGATEAPSTTQETNLPLVQQQQGQDQQQQQQQPEAVYPPPVQERQASDDAYPDPLFPDLKDGANVSWDQAKAMIINGEVRMVKLQGESLNVTLGLKDGRVTYAIVRDPLVVNEAIKECGELCQNIIFMQE